MIVLTASKRAPIIGQAPGPVKAEAPSKGMVEKILDMVLWYC